MLIINQLSSPHSDKGTISTFREFGIFMQWNFKFLRYLAHCVHDYLFWIYTEKFYLVHGVYAPVGMSEKLVICNFKKWHQP